MKRVLLSVSLLVALVASLLIACPCVAADSTPAYGVIAEERVINLPADQNKWYISVVGDPTNARYQMVLTWFDTNQKLKALKNRVHFCPVTTDSAIYKERYAGNVRALPTVRFQKPNGTVIYEAWDKYIPMIDGLNFKGQKHSVYTLLLAQPSATDDQIAQAEAAQPLEFPRGADTAVPTDIEMACYEIAHSLLDGVDPQAELEALAVSSQTYGSVRVAYERSALPIEHLINMVPNAQAWRLLRPYLRDADAIKLSRIS